MRNPDPPTILAPAPQEVSEAEQNLRLCSDNPSPETPVDAPYVPLSAAVAMASYRVSAVFGKLQWISRDAA